MRDTPVNRLERAWTNPEANVGGQPVGIKTKARIWESDVEKFMGNHPQAALAVAAVAGLLLGWIIKRK